MPRSVDQKAPEPEVSPNQRTAAAIALQNFASGCDQTPKTSRDSTTNFFVGLIQLSEQDGFNIDDCLRTARVRVFNAKRK